ncbi:amidohydrolase family protein [Streptomyces sp. NPDC004111]|uniref:amidohydrolase family protein n=1 Tax=Streptomyces sp. NPDC004111 TaxID=3364690 RepID=UPI00367CA0C8
MDFAARTDVHNHIVPPVWAETLAARGLNSGGWAIPAWSPASALAMMGQQGIATGVMSVTSPGVHLGDDAVARDLARAVNEYGAEVVKDHPDRFGHFAGIPLPDIDAAVAEAVYALDVLGADGVVLMSNAHGKYLGDPDLEPLWAELDRRAANVLVHPAQPPMELLPGTPAPLADYVLDATRTALNMVLNGVMDRYRNVRVLLSHGGGFLPYAAFRFSGLTSTVVDRTRKAEDILRDLKCFYFDTALFASPTPASPADPAPSGAHLTAAKCRCAPHRRCGASTRGTGRSRSGAPAETLFVPGPRDAPGPGEAVPVRPERCRIDQLRHERVRGRTLLAFTPSARPDRSPR